MIEIEAKLTPNRESDNHDPASLCDIVEWLPARTSPIHRMIGNPNKKIYGAMKISPASLSFELTYSIRAMKGKRDEMLNG